MPQKKPKKHERRSSRNIRAAIAYGDLTGSLVWSQRINNQGREYRRLMDRLDGLITDLKKIPGWFVKRLGDGFLAVVHANGFGSLELCELLVVLWNFKQTANAAIRAMPVPRPGIYRIRIVFGYVEEKYHVDGDTDYRGYNPGMAAKLLRVYKDVDFVCHQSVKETLTIHHTRKHRFKFKKLSIPKIIPSGVFKEDAESLWSFRVVGPRLKK